MPALFASHFLPEYANLRSCGELLYKAVYMVLDLDQSWRCLYVNVTFIKFNEVLIFSVLGVMAHLVPDVV